MAKDGEDVDSSAAYFELIRAFERFRRMQLHEFLQGVTRSEFFVLDRLQRNRILHPDSPQVYVSTLVKEMHVSPPAVSRTLRGLEAKGLIAREVDPENRRNTFILLTEEGARRSTQAKERMRLLLERTARRMGEDNMKALAALLTQLVNGMQEEIKTQNEREGSCSESSGI